MRLKNITYIKNFYKNYITKTVFHSDKEYTSWIPTNLGNINFDLIAREYRIDEKTSVCLKNKSSLELLFADFKPHLTDLMSLKTSRLIKKNSITSPLEQQHNPIVFISLSFDKSRKLYSGKCYLYFVTNKDYSSLVKELHSFYKNLYIQREQSHALENDLELHKIFFESLFKKLTWSPSSKKYRKQPPSYHNCDFVMEINGKITIKNIETAAITFDENKYAEMASNNDKNIISKIDLSCESLTDLTDVYHNNLTYIAQSLYTVIKRLIHGDNHHHHKLDTIIPVAETPFDPEMIFNSMASRLKEIEVTIREGNTLSAQSDALKAKGLKSYISTFVCLFLKCKESSLMCPILSVEESISATAKRQKPIQTCKEKVYENIKSTIPWILSALILINGLAIYISSAAKNCHDSLKISKAGQYIADQYLTSPFETISFIVFIITGMTILLALLFHKSCASQYYHDYVGRDRLMIISNVPTHRIKAFGLAIIIGLAFLWAADIIDGTFDTFNHISSLFTFIVSWISSVS